MGVFCFLRDQFKAKEERVIRSTRSIERLLGAVIAATLMAGCALAQDTASTSSPAFKLDSGDIAWMLTSSALVLMMTGPGLALFYSGLVRRKNVLGTMMQSFAMMVLITLQWFLFGYSIAFHEGSGWGGLSWMFLGEYLQRNRIRMVMPQRFRISYGWSTSSCLPLSLRR